MLGRGSDDAMHDPELGVDFAGTVTAVGEGVISHRVGDREKNSPDRRRRLHAAWFAQQVSQGRTVPLADATRCALAIATGRHDNLSGRYMTTGEAGPGSRLPGPALHWTGHAS